MSVIDLKVIAPSKPQSTFSKWYAVEKKSKEKFLIGQTVSYTDGDGKHRGLYNSRVLNDIPDLTYDRHAAEKSLNLWAHFIWPSVTAESGNGHHLVINTYDRARFTFGFYQLAAHTPDANLILLFRALVKLPGAQRYFPDLFLKGGRVHRMDKGKTYSLETVTKVHRPNGKKENQIVAFMTYLNPDTKKANAREAYNAGKLMHWLVHDEQALRTSEQVAFRIMHSKLRRQAKAYGLKGKDPRLAIWVSDIRHQGRGGRKKIRAALAAGGLAKQLKALSQVDIYSKKHPKGEFLSRRKAVKKSINILVKEKRFDGVVLGDKKLPLSDSSF